MTDEGRPRPPERPRRREVLDALRNAGSPSGVAEVAERLAIHANTARFHLDALVSEGVVSRTVESPAGPGRPRTVYTPRPGMERGGQRGYRLLARILLSQLAGAGPGAGEAATQAGHSWGRFLVDRPPPFQELTAAQAAGRLTALLEDLGFAPESEDGAAVSAKQARNVPAMGSAKVPVTIRLRHCPFLELAEEYGSIVCTVHLGLMQGALAELQAPLTVTGLEPFAETDACLARLESLS